MIENFTADFAKIVPVYNRYIMTLVILVLNTCFYLSFFQLFSKEYFVEFIYIYNSSILICLMNMYFQSFVYIYLFRRIVFPLQWVP